MKNQMKTMTEGPDDQLSTYFRHIAEHDLLTPDQEQEFAEGIEEAEREVWRKVFARRASVRPVLELLDMTAKFPKLLKAAEAGREYPASKYLKAMYEVSDKLRAADLDRHLIDKVVTALNEDSEVKYLGKIRDALGEAGRRRDSFVKANLRLVVTMARRYDRGGMPLADLIQEGNLGLMHAVNRFDFRRGLRFSTYACWWIRHAISRALADKGRAVRIPVHMLEAQQQLEKVRQGLIKDLSRPPTSQELAEAARVPLKKLHEMHRYIMGPGVSLDRSVHDEDDRVFGDTLADPTTEDSTPADGLTTSKLCEQVGTHLRDLTPIEADILKQRFGLGDDEERTFREIGDQYKLSRERIRQIQNVALDKLRRALEREHGGSVQL